MNKKQSTGRLGENLACKFLKKKGYKIIERNHRQKWGELDIITIASDKTLVFVEVKTMNILEKNTNERLTPEDQLTFTKLKKLQRTSSIYANNNLKLIYDDRGWRIDLMAIDIKDGELFGDIRHYECI